MYTWLVIVHIIIAVIIVIAVLLQVGKGAGMGAAFGGSSESFFGSSGPGNFLEKLTIIAGILFIVTSLVLSYITPGVRGGSNKLFNEMPAPTSSMPVQRNQPALPVTSTTAPK
ncbi:MAG: preprotein translocase subunit SecG [Deltaproteobacteria bacterium]|nr:preprotein translocase subunit SecG [Deltaproteobacteria bacterium]MCL5791461.1 preprotein translocase subunit SecG [Deltaproteobacteria bacterium]